jgi:hypothetical protein
VLLTKVRESLPRQIITAMKPGYQRYQAFRYRLFLKKLGSKERNILILATITKTGTHYMRFLIANYVKLLDKPNAVAVTGNEIDRMLPNGWHTSYLGVRPYKQPSPLLAQIGLHDIPRSHMPYKPVQWRNSRVLHTYRNPMDFAVFLYVYKYEYYAELAGKFSGPVEVLDKHLDAYLEEYISFKKASQSSPANILTYSYEDLVRYPEVCLSTALRWIGFDPNPVLVAAAIAKSSEQEASVIGAGEIWQRNQTPAVNPQMIKDFTKKCIANGSVGLWQDFFSEADITRVKERLEAYGLNLDDFTLTNKD